MKVQDLQKLTNERIQFSVSSDSVVIRSWAYRYADMVRVSDIESVEMTSPTVVRISVPVGTRMGDHEILADLNTGIVSADGKAFDEPVSSYAQKPKTQKKTRCTFTPSINGFSIKSVKTMPSEDGYAVYCKVYFNDKKIGDFVDKGDGGEYSFYADKPYSSCKIEQVVRSFPKIVRDYGFGLMEVEYSIGIMVDDLMEMKDIAKEVKKLEGTGRDYVRIDDWKGGRHLSAEVSATMSDEDMSERLKVDLAKRGMCEFEIRRYRSLDDLYIQSIMVNEKMSIT
jgi:serine protease inhibitor ecotin